MHLALLGTVPGIGGGVRPELHTALPVGTRLTAWRSHVGVFPSTPVERDMQAIGHLEAGLRAAAAGADAVVIDSVGDYGLDALRAALALPAVGAGESGLRAAAAVGRFAIVTVWPASMNFVPEALLSRYGLRERCLGIHNVGIENVIARVSGPDGYLAEVDRGAPAIVTAVNTAVNAARLEGADAVMLGCTCMSPIAATVAAASCIPVINPLAEAVSIAVSQAGARATVGGQILTNRAALLTRMVDAIKGAVQEDCPVCIIGEHTATH
ncbi:aspartate/glutamate racemase family protein [Sphingomonas sp. Mn802worker]|uniref:aspartate/glutamate racemase family protein n=1 Tax=Sphingomonas sp. Mn802worker TaxID=629773 RepID=UPI00036806DF|nr:aspartate/glutamate racemase family protein [Sphingomonas sp. Mn802worker]